MLTIGQLTELLEPLDRDKLVMYDFATLIPTTVASWRGNFADAALGWSLGATIPTVDDLLNELQRALTDTYKGWKGGVYSYGRRTYLHIDNPGECTYTELTGVTTRGNIVMLHTFSNA